MRPPDVGEREAIQHARIYAEDVLGVKWPEVRPLDREEERRLAEDLLRYRQNEPIQYITGKAAFYGLVLKVSPDVLIPRQETEELVHLVLQEHPEPYARVLDIGTGSGCIAIALQHHRPVWYVEAIDVSTAALEVAKANAVNHRVEITFRHMDILQEDPDTPVPFDMIVSNPPYIPKSEQPITGKSVRSYEPGFALWVPDEDPLLFYRTIADKGRSLLKQGGYLYLEVNEYRATAVSDLLEDRGYIEVQVYDDLMDKPRIVSAVRGG